MNAKLRNKDITSNLFCVKRNIIFGTVIKVKLYAGVV